MELFILWGSSPGCVTALGPPARDAQEEGGQRVGRGGGWGWVGGGLWRVQVRIGDAEAEGGAAHRGGGSGSPAGGGAGSGGVDWQPTLRGLQRLAHPGGRERELLQADEEEAAAGQGPDRWAAAALGQEEGKSHDPQRGGDAVTHLLFNSDHPIRCLLLFED